MELLKTMQHYFEVNQCYPGNDYWSKLFEKAVESDKKSFPLNAKVMPNEVVAGGETAIDIRIDENKYWLEYINRFADHVPNTYRKANKHNFIDRIKELEESKPA